MLRKIEEPPSVAIIHPYLWRGGSEACALWAAEALKKSYDVTLLTSSPVDLAVLNRYYGTCLKPGEIKTITIPVPAPLRWGDRFVLIRYYRLYRYCRANASRFALMFSSYNPMDFGRRGIQYVLDPHFTQELLNKIAGYPKGLRRLFYLDSPWRTLYRKLAFRLSGTDAEGYRNNLTLVDSDWTGRLTRRHLGVQTVTVYPPTAEIPRGKPWRSRDNGFVCVGRITPEKRIERILGIVGQLNDQGFDLHLHIIGSVGDRRYYRFLRKLAASKDWVHFEIGVTFARKNEILTSHRFGIHGRENEPFGIVVAEMIKAGCLVWAPNGGGQVEIIDHRELVYDGVSDAVGKIASILRDPRRQAVLRSHLGRRSKDFSVKVYQAQIRQAVKAFLIEAPGEKGSGTRKASPQGAPDEANE